MQYAGEDGSAGITWHRAQGHAPGFLLFMSLPLLPQFLPISEGKPTKQTDK